jgi:hypothetical protein
MDATMKSGHGRPIEIRKQVTLGAEDWDRLPVRLGVLMAEQFERQGYAIHTRDGDRIGKDGGPVDTGEAERVAYFLIGVMVACFAELSTNDPRAEGVARTGATREHAAEGLVEELEELLSAARVAAQGAARARWVDPEREEDLRAGIGRP